MEPTNPLLKRAYALNGNQDDIRGVYADWAKTYEDDTLIGMGYVAPAIAARTLAESLDDNATVLDAGCGTGLVGKELSDHSNATIDGIDLSPAMLKQAEEKNVYRTLAPADLSGTLDIADNSYDGVISVGVFTSGHVAPSALDELVRVGKPGAPTIVTVHEQVWEKDGYREHLARMEKDGIAKIRAIHDTPYHEKEGYRCKLCILEAA